MKRFFSPFFATSLFFTGTVSAENLLDGADVGYGEYLSGECVTCHSQKGVDNGIPVINGLDAEVFATVMHSYKAGVLTASKSPHWLFILLQFQRLTDTSSSKYMQKRICMIFLFCCIARHLH